MVSTELQQTIRTNLVEGGWNKEEAERIVTSYVQCADAVATAGRAGSPTVTIPVAAFVTALYCFGHVLGVELQLEPAA